MIHLGDSTVCVCRALKESFVKTVSLDVKVLYTLLLNSCMFAFAYRYHLFSYCLFFKGMCRFNVWGTSIIGLNPNTLHIFLISFPVMIYGV